MRHEAEQFDFIEKPLPDICESRHGGNEHSIAARASAESLARDKRVVLAIIEDHPESGRTAKEIASEMGKEQHQISGRITELKKDNLVFVRGRRDRCGINFPNVIK